MAILARLRILLEAARRQKLVTLDAVSNAGFTGHDNASVQQHPQPRHEP